MADATSAQLKSKIAGENLKLSCQRGHPKLAINKPQINVYIKMANEEQPNTWLFRLSIALALPTVACFGYYTLGRIDNPDSLTIFLVMMAYPALLVCLLGLVKNLIKKPIPRPKAAFWLGMGFIPTLFLYGLWY